MQALRFEKLWQEVEQLLQRSAHDAVRLECAELVLRFCADDNEQARPPQSLKQLAWNAINEILASSPSEELLLKCLKVSLKYLSDSNSVYSKSNLDSLRKQLLGDGGNGTVSVG